MLSIEGKHGLGDHTTAGAAKRRGITGKGPGVQHAENYKSRDLAR